ncbi:MAG: dihydrolipoyl dehydrogenase [Eubacteriales bacterium]|nr:dihydrolipoyl dehydrogenase [Eubacteriales bacterium]
MSNNAYDLIVIGGGPAGYVAAIRAAQLGLRTAVLEREHLGGTCLNVGCIPTKTLFQSAAVANTVRDSEKYGIKSTLNDVNFPEVIRRKDRVVKKLVNGVRYLLKKNKVDVILGEAKILSSKQVKDTKNGVVYQTKNILIATGSSNAVPPIPGFNGERVIDSTELLSMQNLPKSLVVIGGGVIGCEFASILNAFGCQVTVIEMLPHLLGNMDSTLAASTAKQFSEEHIRVELGAKVKSVGDQDGKKLVTYERNGIEGFVSAEYVLVSTGRKANSAGIGCEELGIHMDHGFIQVDSHMRTSVSGIYAAGDITGQGMLAHTAFAGGTIAIENIAGGNREMDLNAVPKVVFVNSEVASVGMTEEEAKSAGYDVLVGNFNLAGNGKALAMGKAEGFVKIVSEKKDHAILGMQMEGPCAAELVTVGTQLISSELLLEDVEYTIYPHPAVAEAIREACLDALGRAIHA